MQIINLQLFGGRGASSGASKDYNKREFDTVSKANNGKIKVIKRREKNISFPIYSNTPNTTYFVVDENNIPISIVIYRNHKIVENIDMNDNRGIHVHTWNEGKDKRGNTTMIKNRNHNFNLSNKQNNLVKKFIEWSNNK